MRIQIHGNILLKVNPSPINGSLYPNVLTVNIIVVNEKDEPFPGVDITLRNEHEKLIIPYISNREGKISQLNIYDKYIANIRFSFIGRMGVSINTQELFGYENDIRVILHSDSLKYNTATYKEKYFIEEIEEEKMVLFNLDSKKRRVWVFEKKI